MLEDTLPLPHRNFSDVFEKRNADSLPENRPYDCPIDLQEGACPPFGPIYGLSKPELEALRTYLDENLEKGFIQPSKSPPGTLILFSRRRMVRYASVWITVASIKSRYTNVICSLSFPSSLIVSALHVSFLKSTFEGHPIWCALSLMMNGKQHFGPGTTILSTR